MRRVSLIELFRYFRQEKRRTATAMLGIAMGVLSLVLMDSISGAMGRKIQTELGRLGASLVVITPGEVKAMGRMKIRLSQYTTLRPSDIRAIRRLIPMVRAVSGYKKSMVRVQSRIKSSRLTVTSCAPDYATLLDFRLEAGRFITRRDLEGYRKVVVLGHKIATEFFNKAPLGRVLYLNGIPFRVIGVMEKRGSFGGEDFDQMLFVPLTSGMSILENVDYLDGAVVLSQDRAANKAVIREVTSLLLKLHGKRDFSVNTYEELESTATQTLNLFSMLSRIVASMAFSVGALGIVAIMALSIYERLLEIAIKRVVGARKQDIFVQFLLESLFICLFGSTTGMALSILLAILVQLLAGWPLYLPWPTMMAAVVLSVLLGLVAGLYPAAKALEFEPKAILRLYEEA